MDWNEQEQIAREYAADEENCDESDITVAEVKGKWKTENRTCIHISDLQSLQDNGIIDWWEAEEISNRVAAAVGISPEIGRLGTLAVTPDGWAYLIVGRTAAAVWAEESTRMFT